MARGSKCYEMPPDNDCWPHSDAAASVLAQGAVACL